MTEKLLDNVIDNEVYKMKHAEFMNKKIQLEAKEKELNKNSDKFNEHVENIIELGKFLPTLYKEACADKKRKLLKLVISNPTIKGKELILEPIPFLEQVGNLALLKNGGA